MPDSDASARMQSKDPPSEQRNLPVPLAATGANARARGGLLVRLVRLLLGWKSRSMRSDLAVVLGAGASVESGFSPSERTMLRNILELHERRIEDVMVPRADIIAVHADMPLGELLKLFEGAAHSRLVVYNDTLDDPIGMVHIRDLIAFMTQRAAARAPAKPRRRKPMPAGLDLAAIDLSMPLSAAKIVRPILFVPPSMPAIDLLAKMQATRIHLALIIDEYGGSDGLASIEDIVEEIVGEIEDEHDEAEAPTVVRQPDGSFMADARASLEEVTRAVGPEFDVGEAAEDVDTIGGYMMSQAQRLPVRGELVPGPGPFEMEVLDADPRRVKRLRIYRAKHHRAGVVAPAEHAAVAATIAPGEVGVPGAERRREGGPT
ncbi:MAG: HlyC/CorC family transporter [Proteobacteria bacterium]|nr:HlyC/CorC family transporter [Pseudomonadota bacterium]